jgi:hypothetical protein
MPKTKTTNELIDVVKIKHLVKEQFPSYAVFGRTVLGLNDRDGICTRLMNTRKITGDEIFLIADALGVTADDLRLKN